MNGGRIAAARADQVNGWVEKAHHWLAGCCGLLIEQRRETSPQWCGTTGTAFVPRLIVRYNIDVISSQRDVGDISHRRRALVARHVDTLFPQRYAVLGADSAAAPYSFSPSPTYSNN